MGCIAICCKELFFSVFLPQNVALASAEFWALHFSYIASWLRNLAPLSIVPISSIWCWPFHVERSTIHWLFNFFLPRNANIRILTIKRIRKRLSFIFWNILFWWSHSMTFHLRRWSLKSVAKVNIIFFTWFFKWFIRKEVNYMCLNLIK